MLSVQNCFTSIFLSNNKTDFGTSRQRSHISHIFVPALLPYLGVSVLSAMCDEALGHSEGAQPSVISMYPFHEKLEHACVE